MKKLKAKREGSKLFKKNREKKIDRRQRGDSSDSQTTSNNTNIKTTTNDNEDNSCPEKKKRPVSRKGQSSKSSFVLSSIISCLRIIFLPSSI
jgi:hypothetical protein